MYVTNRNKSWEIVNSTFVILTFFLGFANWFAFLYCGYLVKCKKWIYYSFLYAIPLILTLIMRKFTDITFYGIIISGIISIVHVFKIREDFLIKYDKKLKESGLSNADIDKLINAENNNTNLIQNIENVNLKKDTFNEGTEEKPKIQGRKIDF